jgi:catechol 2,3-dioxygenase-like lactoylglutathione lyase family enzyme
VATVSVRHIVDHVDAAIEFYCRYLGFEERMHPAPTFAMLTRGDLRLLLSAPGRGPDGGQALPDGTMPTPGGWNRFSIEVHDLTAVVDTLREAGVRLRSAVVIGVGGQQVLIDDPCGNPIELFEPNATRPAPRVARGSVLPAVFSGADPVARVLHLGPRLPDGRVGGYPSFRGRRSRGVAARGENVQLHELVHPVPVRRVISLYGTHGTTVAQ